MVILTMKEAGNGVYLSCQTPSGKVLPGTLLGFLPGIVYNSFEKNAVL
jgi:hypothetical protein